jgi:SAM-dependent methyltransferase
MTLVSRLRQMVRHNRRSTNPAIRRAIWLLDQARPGLRFLRDREYRAIVLLTYLAPQRLHQTTALTKLNRYPAIFSACQKYFHSREELKILSFGCSTGEEVLTLRQYFPRAIIVGAEINRSLLSACRRLSVDDRIAFIYSDPDEIRRHAPFDAVFCMAVLQRTPHCVADLGLDSLKDLYPFEKFDRQISELDRLLEPGGLLIVHHTQYLVGDATVADNYEPLASFPPTRTPELKFDKSSRRIEGASVCSPIFVKRGTGRPSLRSGPTAIGIGACRH